MALEILPLGDAGLILRVGDSLGEVLATVRKLEAARIPGVIEIAPAFASVGVFLASPAFLASCAAAIPAALRARKHRGATVRQPRTVEVPVCYDPEFALDLETVAQHCHLSPNEIVKRHAAARYKVRCIGFTPGFPYLSGLPPALVTPRRATPRTALPAGSVAIGGGQTGIYPLVSPGGWNIIGRTPLRLFDLARDPAALLAAGDRVRFVAITREEFAQWAK
ncbi:MAG TPA: 5-oxoprolinase subunit PxpB [Chthoniobacterales bacterium]|jgi:inhibitor of KinA|nr:5-oxoprolinase subunit PxpB [Chthoniobacterales bacterium]